MIMCVLWFVVGIVCGFIAGVGGSGGGWEYSCIGSLHFNASVSNFIGK